MGQPPPLRATRMPPPGGIFGEPVHPKDIRSVCLGKMAPEQMVELQALLDKDSQPAFITWEPEVEPWVTLQTVLIRHTTTFLAGIALGFCLCRLLQLHGVAVP